MPQIGLLIWQMRGHPDFERTPQEARCDVLVDACLVLHVSELRLDLPTLTYGVSVGGKSGLNLHRAF